MPELAEVLRAVAVQAGDANAAKQRGLYVDLLADGTLSLPQDVSESQARDSVARAREVGASAALLHDQDALARFANPPAGALTLADTLFGRLAALNSVDADGAAALISELATWLASAEIPPEV